MTGFWEKNPEMASFKQWTIDRLISSHVYNLISGGVSNAHWLTWLFECYLQNRKELKVLSIGCGVGDHEIAMSKFESIVHIDAFDGSKQSIQIACQKIDCENSKINFYVDDFNTSIFSRNEYDVVIMSGSLHHVKELEHLLFQVIGCMKEEAVFVANEYCGACYNIYDQEQIDLVNDVLNNLPLECKYENSQLVNPTLLDVFKRDPSEAVRSKLIKDFIKIFFKSVDERPFGGYLLHPIYPFLKLDGGVDSIYNSLLISPLISFDNFLRKSGKSDFSFFICQK